MIDFLATFMVHPMTLTRLQQMLLLLPLCLCVSVVYKATKLDDIRHLPGAAAISWITIVVGMYVVGALLLLVYELAA